MYQRADERRANSAYAPFVWFEFSFSRLEFAPPLKATLTTEDDWPPHEEVQSSTPIGRTEKSECRDCHPDEERDSAKDEVSRGFALNSSQPVVPLHQVVKGRALRHRLLPIVFHHLSFERVPLPLPRRAAIGEQAIVMLS
jgi:hypothetical protein